MSKRARIYQNKSDSFVSRPLNLVDQLAFNIRLKRDQRNFQFVGDTFEMRDDVSKRFGAINIRSPDRASIPAVEPQVDRWKDKERTSARRIDQIAQATL